MNQLIYDFIIRYFCKQENLPMKILLETRIWLSTTYSHQIYIDNIYPDTNVHNNNKIFQINT